MKHIKKVLLVLCMITCLFGMTACSTAKDDSVDVTLAANLEQIGTEFLEMFNGLTETDLISYKEQTELQKDTIMYAALDSWQGVQEDLGAFVAIDDIEVTQTSDGYMIKVNASYEKRKMTFSMGVDKQVSEYTSMSFNPVYSTGERLAKAGLNTLMGMGTVFLVLIFISLLIYCFKFIHAWEERQKQAKIEKQPIPAPVPVVETVEEVEEDVTDDLELVAVITAAIAAASENTSTNGLVVRSIKRVPASKWKRA
ncbi:MAG: OadG family transporter subunit [bacterium]|nr:OadG family transporter subunit [bacterium]